MLFFFFVFFRNKVIREVSSEYKCQGSESWELSLHIHLVMCLGMTSDTFHFSLIHSSLFPPRFPIFFLFLFAFKTKSNFDLSEARKRKSL